MASMDARFLQQAEGYLDLELPAPALDALRRVSRKARDGFEWNFLCSEAYRLLERYEDALPLLQRCRELQPETIGIYVNLGWCYKRTGRLPQAIDALRAAHRQCVAIKNQSEHALVMYNLSCYYSLAGEKEETLYWLDLALKKAPNFTRLIAAESDFDRFRDDPDFRQLIEHSAKRE